MVQFTKTPVGYYRLRVTRGLEFWASSRWHPLHNLAAMLDAIVTLVTLGQCRSSFALYCSYRASYTKLQKKTLINFSKET